ncbi:MAG: DUF3793 family protein [Pseudomonadota bacterium]|nr:DUF3793 family protein [Pseudomonadota bacterium]
MQCLKEYQATDFHKIGHQFLMITKEWECLRFDQDEKIIERKKMAPDDLFKFKLLYHLAATMTGIKPITIMRFKAPQPAFKECSNCTRQWQEIRKHFLGQQTLGMRLLDCNQRGESLIFFHHEACRRLLLMPRVKAFLREQGFGYGSETINNPERFIDYCLKEQQQNGSLPVEMGLFMGIPLKDVRGYIKADKKNHIMTAGWRIYEELYPSLALVNLYRRLRQYAVRAYFKQTFEEITERLGQSRLINRIELLAS